MRVKSVGQLVCFAMANQGIDRGVILELGSLLRVVRHDSTAAPDSNHLTHDAQGDLFRSGCAEMQSGGSVHG